MKYTRAGSQSKTKVKRFLFLTNFHFFLEKNLRMQMLWRKWICTSSLECDPRVLTTYVMTIAAHGFKIKGKESFF